MATPGQLIDALHRATGIALPTLVDLDRKLVTGGLRTKAGRGRSAARMTPLDAARLLTAVLASPQANAAVEAVNRYARTSCNWKASGEDLRTGQWIDGLGSLSADHSFVDALAALLDAAPIGAESHASRPRIEISALTRATRGTIRISGQPKSLKFSMDYASSSAIAKSVLQRRSDRGQRTTARTGDLEESRQITERTLFVVAECLNI